MKDVEILAMQIKKTLEKLRKLNEENRRLRLEVEYLKKENERNRKQASEYVVLRKNTELAVCKIERIIKKIDTVRVS